MQQQEQNQEQNQVKEHVRSLYSRVVGKEHVRSLYYVVRSMWDGPQNSVCVNDVTFNSDDLYDLLALLEWNLDYVKFKTEKLFLYTDKHGKPITEFESEYILTMLITYDPNYETWAGEYFEIKLRFRA